MSSDSHQLHPLSNQEAIFRERICSPWEQLLSLKNHLLWYWKHYFSWILCLHFSFGTSITAWWEFSFQHYLTLLSSNLVIPVCFLFSFQHYLTLMSSNLATHVCFMFSFQFYLTLLTSNLANIYPFFSLSIDCLTWDRGAVGSSLTGVTALCPWGRTLSLA